MDILIQPLLQKASRLTAAMHIRYSARSQTLGESGMVGSLMSLDANEGITRMTSYVIIRREYSYLEPLIRSMFGDATDVMVFIDRRASDRGITSETPTERDRRSSSPMLEILINVS